MGRRTAFIGLFVVGVILQTLCPAVQAGLPGVVRNRFRASKQPSSSVPVPPQELVETKSVVASVSNGGAGSDTFTVSRPFAVKSCLLLAFNCGFINGLTLSGGLFPGEVPLKQATAAVTGGWTTTAVSAALSKWDTFTTQAIMILCYLSGSSIASIINPNPVPFQVSRSKHGSTFLLGAALLCGASMIASKDSSVDPLHAFRLAAIVCGMQNSVTSTITSNLCRTAHMSGITSDMGTFLGQILRGNNQNREKFFTFVGLALSFWLGGVVSVFVGQSLASSSLLISAALHLAVGSGLFIL